MRIEEELRTYFHVLWRYKWMIAGCALVAMTVALVVSLQLTPHYSATSTLRVASAPGGSSDYTYLSSFTRFSNTYVEIATSDISLNKVADRLGLEEQPDVEVEVVPETELITIEAFDPDPIIARDVANTLATIMVEESTELYGGNAPTAREILEEQMEQAKADLDGAVSEYDSALRRAQSTMSSPVEGAPSPDPNLDALARIVSVRQQIYADLLQKYETARTNEQLRANAITVFEHAELPEKAATPKVPLNAALGLAGGFAAGLILSFVFEAMDDSVRGIEDVQALTTLPILCTIPETKRRWRLDRQQSFSSNGFVPLTPAFDQLGARLILSDDERATSSFLITSPEPGAGKSTIAAKLAESLADAGHRIALIDMDFRRPRIHAILGLPNDKGLGDFFRGDIALETTLQKTKCANLDVITAGSNAHVPAEWLAPAKVGNLLETLAKEYDYLLVDSPAFLSVADPTVIATQTDAVILVVARRKTGRRNLQFALQQLTELGAEVAGVVLNKMPYSHMYRYYAEGRRKLLPFRVGKTGRPNSS